MTDQNNNIIRKDDLVTLQKLPTPKTLTNKLFCAINLGYPRTAEKFM